MGRPLSPPQIHQKIIWMLSSFHRITSECWQRTPGTQKGSPFSLKGGHLYLLPPPSLLYLTLWISLGVLGCGEHLRNWLLARLVSLLLSPPSSPPGHLYLLPPSSLLYVILWTSLIVQDCGEHLGNWSLARLVSPLLSPPLLLLTSISLVPLLFSIHTVLMIKHLD